MRELPKYLPDDQKRHLGDPPWMWNDPRVMAWVDGHDHDPRTKCRAESRCQALDNHYEWLLEALDREREAYAELAAAYEEASRRRGELDVARVVYIGRAIATEWDRTPDGEPLGIDLAHAALNAIDEWEAMPNDSEYDKWSSTPFHLLLNYSEWLNVEDGDLWEFTHEDLVTAFIATLDPDSSIGRLAIRP